MGFIKQFITRGPHLVGTSNQLVPVAWPLNREALRILQQLRDDALSLLLSQPATREVTCLAKTRSYTERNIPQIEKAIPIY